MAEIIYNVYTIAGQHHRFAKIQLESIIYGGATPIGERAVAITHVFKDIITNGIRVSFCLFTVDSQAPPELYVEYHRSQHGDDILDDFDIIIINHLHALQTNLRHF